jgi:ABC-type glutathione transport system ATPase component
MKIEQLTIKNNGTTLVDIAFDISSSLALVGESGSGKSLTIKAFLNMLPNNLEHTLHVKSNFELKAGETIGFVPQNPFTALSPLTKIKHHFPNLSHINELFAQVGLDDSLREHYPSELSGGQLQRVIIAIALSSHPKLLLLDEPTTALDANTRELILSLIKDLQGKYGFKLLFVTHDIISAKQLCSDICVIKNGKLIEFGKITDVLQNPQDIYTKTLIEANFSNREFRQ